MLTELARGDVDEAVERLRAYSPEEVAGALPQLPARRRVEILELCERADEVVPLLPETELAVTVRGAGIEEAGWLVRYATSEQRVAAVDVDCWRDDRLSPGRLLQWIDALIEAGPETLAASFDELDPELWVLAMKHMARFRVLGIGNVDLDECTTDDGLVFYSPNSGEDEERVRAILDAARTLAPSRTLQLVLGAISDSAEELDALASRWQRGRLADLGFPERSQAMRVYRPLAVGDAPPLFVGPGAGRARAGARPGAVPSELSGSLVGRALAELSPERAGAVMRDVLAVANAVAIADRLPLTERETVERSLAKALRGIDGGLAELARARDQALSRVLDGTPALDLFRIGATLDPDLQPGTMLADLLEEEEQDDWAMRSERIDEEDMTVGTDGRPRR